MHLKKRNLFNYFTLALCAGIMVYFVIVSGGIDQLIKLFTTLRARWLWSAIGAAIMVWVMEAASFHAISSHVYEGWKFSYSFISGMVGLLYCAITPFSTGGQPMQVYCLHQKGMSTGAAVAIVTVRSLVYQVALMVFSLLMVVLRLSYFTENVSGFTVLLLIGLAINVVYVGFLILVMHSPKATTKVVRAIIRLLGALRIVKKTEEKIERVSEQVTLFHENVSLLGRDLKMYLSSFFFSFLQFVFQCLIPYFFYVACFYDKAIYRKEDILTIMAAQAFVLMVSYFIPTPGAAGGAEVSYLGFFGKFYHNIVSDAAESGRLIDPATSLPYTEQAVQELATGKLTGTMFLWRFISFYFTILAGSVFVSVSNRQRRLNLKNRLFDETQAEEHPENAPPPSEQASS